MEYTTIFILNKNMGEGIIERPRDFVGNILKALDGDYHNKKQKDFILGYEKIGEVLPIKNNEDDSLYIFHKGRLVEFNPNLVDFDELKIDKEFYNNAISVLESIYNKVKGTGEKPSENTEDKEMIDMFDNIDDLLNEVSDVDKMKDEIVEKREVKKSNTKKTTNGKSSKKPTTPKNK